DFKTFDGNVDKTVNDILIKTFDDVVAKTVDDVIDKFSDEIVDKILDGVFNKTGVFRNISMLLMIILMGSCDGVSVVSDDFTEITKLSVAVNMLCYPETLKVAAHLWRWHKRCWSVSRIIQG
ncbi:25857_t:CDS:2, partial [Gigaspora rosea]